MTNISQADPTAEVVKNMVSPAQSGIDYVAKRYLVEALASGAANAFAFAVQNPEGVDCVVTNVIVDITTAGGTASSVLDVDVVDGATDTGDDIIDGLDLNATGTFDRHKNAGTNGGAARQVGQEWGHQRPRHRQDLRPKCLQPSRHRHHRIRAIELANVIYRRRP